MHDAGAGAGCSASGTHHKVPEKETSSHLLLARRLSVLGPVGVVVAAATSASEGPAAAAAVTLRA